MAFRCRRRLSYGRSQRYMSVYAAFAFSFAWAGAGMLIAALASTVVGFVIGMMFFGVGLGWFVPNLADRQRNRAVQRDGASMQLPIQRRN